MDACIHYALHFAPTFIEQEIGNMTWSLAKFQHYHKEVGSSRGGGGAGGGAGLGPGGGVQGRCVDCQLMWPAWHLAGSGDGLHLKLVPRRQAIGMCVHVGGGWRGGEGWRGGGELHCGSGSCCAAAVAVAALRRGEDMHASAACWATLCTPLHTPAPSWACRWPPAHPCGRHARPAPAVAACAAGAGRAVCSGPGQDRHHDSAARGAANLVAAEGAQAQAAPPHPHSPGTPPGSELQPAFSLDPAPLALALS
jgi:hypothetical protein